MEQEKNALRGVLEYEAGKRFDLFSQSFMIFLFSYSLTLIDGILLCS